MTVQIQNNTPEEKPSSEELLQQLIEQGKENNELLHKIRSYQNQQRIMAYLKILIIVVPIVLSIIYLPTILKPFWDQYQQAIGLNPGTDLNLQNLQKTLKELKQ
jgi:hypothetical protein